MLVEYIAVEVVLNVTRAVCTSSKGANVCNERTLAVENVLVTCSNYLLDEVFNDPTILKSSKLAPERNVVPVLLNSIVLRTST